eukprot:113905-Prymnesium_polylepis.1
MFCASNARFARLRAKEVGAKRDSRSRRAHAQRMPRGWRRQRTRAGHRGVTQGESRDCRGHPSARQRSGAVNSDPEWAGVGRPGVAGRAVWVGKGFPEPAARVPQGCPIR